MEISNIILKDYIIDFTEIYLNIEELHKELVNLMKFLYIKLDFNNQENPLF